MIQNNLGQINIIERSDKKAFGQIAQNYHQQLKMETTIVGDSALYSKEN